MREKEIPGHSIPASLKADNKHEELYLGEIIRGLRKGFRFFLRRWMYVLSAAILGGTIGFIMAWMSAPSYTARLNFVLEEGKTGGSGLSALAGQFGFDLGGIGGGSNILAGDNIIGLLKSNKLAEKTLRTPFDAKLSLADRYADVLGLRKQWKSNPSIDKDIFFPATEQQLDPLRDSLLSTLTNRITRELVVERPDKRMTFYEVTVTLSDELLSKYFAERLVNYAVQFYIDTKTSRQRANIDRLQRRADSILALLNNRTYNAAAAQSRILDVNPAYQTATVAAELNNRDKTVVATIYIEIVKNLEMQKATLTQQTPVIQVVDEASLPLKINRKSKRLYALFGAFMATLVAMASITAYHTFKKYS